MSKKLTPEQIKLKEDIQALKYKVNNMEEQIREEERVKSKLRNDAEEKLKHIELADASIEKEKQKFFLKHTEIMDALSIVVDDGNYRLKELNSAIEEIASHVAGIDIIEVENNKLHSRLKQQSIEYKKQALVWREDIDKRKRQNFDTRVKLEEVFRSTVKIFDKDSRLEAVRIYMLRFLIFLYSLFEILFF